MLPSKVDGFLEPQVPIIVGILNLVLLNTGIAAQVLSPLPNMSRNPTYHVMVMKHTSSCLLFSLDWTSSSASDNWGKLPSVVSLLSLGLVRAAPRFLHRKIFPFNWKLQFLHVLWLQSSIAFYLPHCLRLSTAAPRTFVIPERSLIFPAAES